MDTAPICLFVYKRIDSLKLTVEALQKNYLSQQSDLYIFSDSAKALEDQKSVNTVREYLRSIDGFREVVIHESTQNNGLANSIIEGVSKILEDHKNVIVLEDDLVTTRNFLLFMNQALDYYDENTGIKSINGFSLKIKSNRKGDVFFHSRTYSWGWATWQNRWNKDTFSKKRIKQKITQEKLDQFRESCGADAPKMLMDSLEGLNDSWYARWMYSHFEEDKLAVYPYKSKVRNVGFSKEGTHCKTINIFSSSIDGTLAEEFDFRKELFINEKENIRFLQYFTRRHKIISRLSLLRSFSGLDLLRKDLILQYSKLTNSPFLRKVRTFPDEQN